jgi:PAS domain S-box-containing protein
MKLRHAPRSDGRGTESLLLSAIVDSTDDAIISVDVSGRVTSWNKGAERLYGIAAAQAVSATLDQILPSSAADLAKVLRGSETTVSVHREVTRRLSNGSEVLVDETVSVLRNEAGKVVGAASIARDVTSRHDIEAALAATRRDLEVHNRRLERSNADLEQFAYVASHDLSEPLRAVSGMVELLARRYDGQLDDDADEFIRFAVDGCARMRAMIDDLLSYSRAGSEGLKLTDVDLAVVMEHVLESLSVELAASEAVLSVGDLPVVRADSIKLTAVIQNLIGNALKFRLPERQTSIAVSAESDNGVWRIAVTDNGIGVEPAYRGKVFRMFQRLNHRESYPGTGIGLAISERIVSAHGGMIGVADGVDGGVSVWFTLPQSEEVSV